MAQFEKLNLSYGAPMGRAEWREPPTKSRSVRVFRVNLDSGGYDDGGAYWGLGQALWCATDGENYRMFCRAESRVQAIVEFRLAYFLLKKPPVSFYKKIRHLEFKGTLSAGGVILRQKLDSLGFDKIEA